MSQVGKVGSRRRLPTHTWGASTPTQTDDGEVGYLLHLALAGAGAGRRVVNKLVLATSDQEALGRARSVAEQHVAAHPDDERLVQATRLLAAASAASLAGPAAQRLAARRASACPE